MTRAELELSLQSGNKIFRKVDLSGQDLTGLDLSGCDLRRSNLKNANLSGSNLTNAILVLCDIHSTNFSGATIDGVNWEMVVNADKAILKGAIYEGVALTVNATSDKVGKYVRVVTDRFIQIGCLKGNESYWDSMDDAKLNAEVDKVSPSEKAEAKAWKDANLATTISEQKNKKPK